jgi:hypothetical protein
MTNTKFILADNVKKTQKIMEIFTMAEGFKLVIKIDKKSDKGNTTSLHSSLLIKRENK